jgi:DNA-binding response OmpR family regulator
MSPKILLVDEKNVLARLIQRHLEDAGYELINARNETEAASAIARENPRVVVVDQPAPFLHGSEGLSGGKPPFLHPSVIRLTDVRPFEPPEAASREMVLTKPYSPTHLLAEIKRLATLVQA